MVEGRLSTLSRSLDARDRPATAEAITRMLAGFPSARQAGDDARVVLAAYVTLVDEFPPWAVAEACRRRATGAFPPSAGELREGCLQVVDRYRRERGKLQQALTAQRQPTPAGEKERVSTGFDSLRAEIAAQPAVKKQMTPEEARAALVKRCEELGIDPAVIDRVEDRGAPMWKGLKPDISGLKLDIG